MILLSVYRVMDEFGKFGKALPWRLKFYKQIYFFTSDLSVLYACRCWVF